MLQEIILNLGANFKSGDEDILNSVLTDVICQCKAIAHRADVETSCKFEIIDCVKSLYLLRGTEDTSELRTPENNLKYIDAMERLRSNVVKNGKRLIV